MSREPREPVPAPPPRLAPPRPHPAGELAWLFLGLFTTVLYALAAAGRGFGAPKSRIGLFQVLPLAGAALWRWRPDTFYRWA